MLLQLFLNKDVLKSKEESRAEKGVMDLRKDEGKNALAFTTLLTHNLLMRSHGHPTCQSLQKRSEGNER